MRGSIFLPLALASAAAAVAWASQPEPPDLKPSNQKAASPVAAAPVAQPVAVELFTSQGCSSCPPADAVMERLARDPRVVAITRPVTYWDRLGWKDTLARPANTELQRDYTRRGISGAGNYTPQTVVQGRHGLVGGREAAIRATIAQELRTPRPRIAIVGTSGQMRTIVVHGDTRPARISVVALRRMVDVRIGSGENGGRRVRYANVLVGETPVGAWGGGPMRMAIPAAALRVAGADRYAVIVREGDAGPILAARYL